MTGCIMIGDKYLVEIEVENGYAGHSALVTLPCTGIITSEEPYYFGSRCIGNKVKEVVELMRYGDIEIQNINISMKK